MTSDTAKGKLSIFTTLYANTRGGLIDNNDNNYNYANTGGGLIEENKIPIETKMKNRKKYCKKILIKNSYEKNIIKKLL